MHVIGQVIDRIEKTIRYTNKNGQDDSFDQVILQVKEDPNRPATQVIAKPEFINGEHAVGKKVSLPVYIRPFARRGGGAGYQVCMSDPTK